MKSVGRALLVSGALIGLLGACGAIVIEPIGRSSAQGEEPEKPLVEDPKPSGEGGGGAGGGGAGGGLSPAGGWSEPVNTCQCLASVSMNFNGEYAPGAVCTQCLRDTGQDDPNGPCREKYKACEQDPACHWIWTDCLSTNGYNPDIIASCILPFDKDEAHKKFQAIAQCACAHCTDACEYPDPIECVAP